MNDEGDEGREISCRKRVKKRTFGNYFPAEIFPLRSVQESMKFWKF